ncbi:Peptidyl-prolyl cis-trans isomerase 9 [Candida viswanathii]|uniref:peptidylprolyl isomerase n=1 Tax=Candida viswanathii TaxID=5486 RepID=A0A367YBU7_9ASCO|nr:Peptidyl-prolyl cis-trans isomerase 9 [Candida viswanathii]
MKRKYNPPLNIPIVPSHCGTIDNESQVSVLVMSDSHVVVGSVNGTIKFYTVKDNSSLECVKQYNAHGSNTVKQLLLQGSKLASIAEDDKHIKIFDLNTLDMIQTIELPFLPNVSTSISNSWHTNEQLMISSTENELHCVSLEDVTFEKVKNMHKFEIRAMRYNSKYGCFVSVDEKGLIEIWDPLTFEIPSSVLFKMKSLTDLFYFRKNKLLVEFVEFSSDQESFACGYDNGIQVFDMKTGKIVHAVQADRVRNSTVLFDKNSVVYSTSTGIEVYDLDLQESDSIGSDDALEFHQFGILKNSKIGILTTEMITSDNAIINSKLSSKPILVSSVPNSSQIYIFSDVSTADTPVAKKPANYTKATLHTTKGDIKIQLFPQHTPKTVENFITLCKQSYYNNVIFHRVIPEFMIQTGDPKGDGTGGESCWGGYFKDEFTDQLSHEKYMVSMANAGANTNGSQFFITTEDVTFLDGKHTIFGKVVSGTDVVQSIEEVETDKDDKPLDRIVILSTTLEK